MKYRTGAALCVAAILTGSTWLPAVALADERTDAVAPEAAALADAELQQELAARLQKDADAMAADAMTAASDLKLPLQLEGIANPRTLVLVSDL